MPGRVAVFGEILGVIAAGINAEYSELPFHDKYVKHGTIVHEHPCCQLRWPIEPSEFPASRLWDEKSEIFLRKRATEAIAALNNAIRESKFAHLYRLELPFDLAEKPNALNGALWCQPVRFVWLYNISTDAIMFRYDMIGSPK